MPIRRPDTSLIDDAIAVILEHQDFLHFHRWLKARTADPGAPTMGPADGSEAEHRSRVTHLAMEFWNATPLPGNDYRPDPIPKPQRNQPCPCGSGVKYKRCCRRGSAPPPISPEVAWSAVIDHLGEPELATVGASGAVPPQFLADLADMLLDQGSPHRAARLLEPVFQHPQGLGEAYLVAFQVLQDAYDQLEWDDKMVRLLETVADEAPPILSSAAWQVIAAIAADAEDWDTAWACVAEARRRTPDRPPLDLLEVTLLGSEGRFGEAAERARLALEPSRRDKFPLNEAGLAFLQRAVSQPETMFDADVDGSDHLPRLQDALLAALERPLPPYFLDPDAGLPTLTAPPELAEVEESWSDVWPMPSVVVFGPSPPETIWEPAAAERWVRHLEERPESFDSLAILEDLVFAADTLDPAVPDPEVPDLPPRKPVLLPLLLTRRAEAILDALLPASEGLPPGVQAADQEGDVPGLLPWIVIENRTLLRLMLRRAGALRQAGDAQTSRSLLERILTLNPLDNQGARGRLLIARLHAGDDEGVLDLSDRYPKDAVPEHLWSRLLALVRLERHGEALSTLAEVHRRNPHVADELCRGSSRHSRSPSASPLSRASEGIVPARRYVAEVRTLWEEHGRALDWLCRSRSALKP